MSVTTTDSTVTAEKPEDAAAGAPTGPTRPDRLVEEDVLVEDVSIDGMCGVY